MHFNVKPDYAGLLSKKFSSFLEEISECEEHPGAVREAPENANIVKANDEENHSDEEDDTSSVPSLARGRKL